MMKLAGDLVVYVIIGLNAFITFALVFEDRIVLPDLLKALGRTHPLLVHFPIVLMLLVPLAEWTSGYWATSKAQRQKLVVILLSATALGAAMSAAMGLMLSLEDGYSGGTLDWHKWTGVSFSILSAALLWTYTGVKKNSFVVRVPMLLACVLLLVVGHLGASLTHGKDFVLAPLRISEEKKIDIRTARVFDDLVMPVFQAKCLGCHNPDKAKGSLVLSDSLGISEGGETGKVIQPGAPAESLLIQRVLLDEYDEDHMPPKGKPQLTLWEVAVLKAWISAGAGFNIGLAELPATDTLHALAVAVAMDETDSFDFDAVDAEVVQQLNNPYRTVAHISWGSPALAVNIYNKNTFDDEALTALDPIRDQVVSLNLSGMPVSEKQARLIGRFVNLRELNLNYVTTISDDALQNLTGLSELRTLSLCGTKITNACLKTLASLPTLEKVYVWNTAITPSDVKSHFSDAAYPKVILGARDSVTTGADFSLHKKPAKK